MGNAAHVLGICDRCGFRRKLHQLRKEWTGLKVCSDTCWEPRHPQEFVRGVKDDQSVYEPRPEPADVFLVSYLYLEDGSVYQEQSGYPIVLE